MEVEVAAVEGGGESGDDATVEGGGGDETKPKS